VIASGGVSSLEDVKALTEMKLYGAIIGKAYYTGAVDLKEAIRISKNDN
jgi:phosphoribosylformimino-5-aminoimidazole carboxamide ribotide isomerase